MAIPNDVRPGDLITAQFVNALLAELRAISGRVATLEARPEGEPSRPQGTIEIEFDSASLQPAAGRALNLRYVISNGTFSRATLDVRAAATGLPTNSGTGVRGITLPNTAKETLSGAELDVFPTASATTPQGEYSVAAGDDVELFVRVPARLVEAAIKLGIKPRVEVRVLQDGRVVTQDSQRLTFDRRDL